MIDSEFSGEILSEPVTVSLNLDERADLFYALVVVMDAKVRKKELKRLYVREIAPLRMLPHSLAHNIQRSAELLGISPADFIKAGLLRPRIFGLNPERLDAKVTASAALLGVSKEVFVKAALVKPALFYRKSAQLKANAEKTATILKIDEARFIETAMHNAQILCLTTEKLHANVTGNAALMEIPKEQFVAAALKCPQLFYLRPAKLNANVTASAQLLGVSKAAFVETALGFPQLFYLKPETLAVKKPYVVAIAAAMGDNRDFAELFNNRPNAVCNGTNALHARYVIAKLHLIPHKTLSGLLTLQAARAEELITQHYTEKMETEGKGMRTLQVLHARGIISRLPSGVRPITRPAEAQLRPAV